MVVAVMRCCITTGKQSGDPFPPGLEKNGPITEVEVAIPSAWAEYLTRQKLPVPDPIKGFALFDTGAETTAVYYRVIEALGVNPIGPALVLTPGGSHAQQRYPVRLIFEHGIMNFEFKSVLGADLEGWKVKGGDLIALIGRDVLSKGIFVYNGINATATFAL